MKKIFLIIISVAFLFLQGSQNYSNQNLIQSEDSIRVIKLTFVGDIMCHTPQIELAKINSDSFDFRPYFSEVKKYLYESDLTFGNLETVIAGKSKVYSGYPLFNSPENLLDALKDVGFDILFTSNNHSLDRGIDGIVSTIQQLKKRNLINVGTYISEKERESLLIIESNDFRLGVLSYTYGLNGNYLPKTKSYMINLIDTNLVKNDISKIHKYNPDLVLVYFHFGEEYSRTPSNYQKILVEKTFNYGADIIIGSHPHVIQPKDFYEKRNGKLKQGFVAYSLGNFISNQRWRYSDAGTILNLKIAKNITKDSIWVDKLNFIPTWVYKGKINGSNSFKILPSDTTLLSIIPKYLSKADKQKLIESYYDTIEILSKK